MTAMLPVVSFLRNAIGLLMTFLFPSWYGPATKYRPEDHYMRGRLVVIGHDRKDGIGAQRFSAPRQFDGMAGRIRTRAGNQPDATVRDVHGGPHDALPLRRRQGRGFTSDIADHEGGDRSRDLAFAKPFEGFQVDRAGFVEWGGEIGYVARQPTGWIYCGHHGDLRRLFNLAEALTEFLTIGGKHEAVVASHACLDPKAQLLEFLPYF